CQLNLFSSEYASSPTSVGIGAFDVGWSLLGDLRFKSRSICPSGHLGADDPAHRPLRGWEGELGRVVKIEQGEICCLGERLAEARGSGKWWKDRRKSPHKVDRATTRGKRLVNVLDEPPAPRQRPKLVRELCSARAGVDGRDYHATRMCNLPERSSDAPLNPDLSPLTHGTQVWQSGEASATYIRGMLIPRLATDLYTLLSEVLMDGAAKAMVLNQHYQTTLFDHVHDAGRVITSLDSKVTLLRQELQDLKEGGNPNAIAAAEADLEVAQAGSASLERQLADLWERLGDSEDQLQGARAQVRQMEIELLDLARSKEALRENLSKKAIEKYKESPGFEMSLVRMGRVSLEYRY
ncbi:hypothetical protein BHM03_00054187, partial [Ensete ventricosum]